MDIVHDQWCVEMDMDIVDVQYDASKWTWILCMTNMMRRNGHGHCAWPMMRRNGHGYCAWPIWCVEMDMDIVHDQYDASKWFPISVTSFIIKLKLSKHYSRKRDNKNNIHDLCVLCIFPPRTRYILCIDVQLISILYIFSILITSNVWSTIIN